MAAEGQADLELLTRLIAPLGAEAALHRARDLLARHESLPRVLDACRRSPDRAEIVRHLATVGEALIAAAKGRLSSQPVLRTSGLAADYLMLEMAHLPVEQVRVLFLNASARLIADEVLAMGTIDHAPTYPREIIRRAIELGAASIILAHNHPSGDPKPSEQDVAITRQLLEGGAALGIALFDHLVLASSGWVSLRAQGFI